MPRSAQGCRGGRRRPHYLLQQRPQAQLVRAAALRPLAHIGRRHQPLAAALVLRVHGRGAPGAATAALRSPPAPSGPVRAGHFPPGRGGRGRCGARSSAELRGSAPPPVPSSGQGSAEPPPPGPARPLGGAGPPPVQVRGRRGAGPSLGFITGDVPL